jgi:hypothetical protein
MFGIEAIEIYFPKTYVQQSEFGNTYFYSEIFNKVSKGKYTAGLGQL